MSTDTKYNGWTNYETWAVNLWLTNDEGSQNYWTEAAQEAQNDAEDDKTFNRRENAQIALADRLKDEHEENTPELDGVYGDILRAGFSAVNWYEIAGSLLNGLDD